MASTDNVSTALPRVAVIGGGISGLACAYALSHTRTRSVTLFERWDRLGMDAFGQNLTLPEGECRIDMPLRVFSPTYYEQLMALYSHVGVRTETCDHAATFITHRGPGAKPIFRYDNIDIGSLSLPVPSLTSIRIVAQYLRFLAIACARVWTGVMRDDESFGEFLTAHGFSAEFTDGMLVPALAAMLTCSSASVRAYPAGIIVEYVLLGALSRTRRVAGGAAEVVERLSSCIDDVRLGAKVKHVRPVVPEDGAAPGMRVRVLHADGSHEDFHDCVFATQANQALDLLGKAAAPSVRRALSSFLYESSATVIHTDASVMPPDRKNWASVVFHLRASGDGDASPTSARGAAAPARAESSVETIIAGSPIASDVGAVAIRSRPEATIWLNAAQQNLSHLKTQVFQTWNPHVEPAPGTVLKRVVFDRPVLNVGSVAGMKLLAEAQGRDGLWWCGSYALYGMPLLDNGVAAGLRVAAAMGARMPWDRAPTAASIHDVTGIRSIYRFTDASKRLALARLLVLPACIACCFILLTALLLTYFVRS